jgi:SAM-dependent methyltransferase
MPDFQNAKFVSSNRDAWNESANFHRNSPSWQILLDAISKPDFSCFDTTITNLLESVGIADKDIVQIGCNNGRECISLLGMGANSVVGVDQSTEFLVQARELGARSLHKTEFVEADVYNLPSTLIGQFDRAIITIGVLNWMPDLAHFFTCVSSTLRDGGILVIYETHPFLDMFDPEAGDPFKLTNSYFRAEPLIFESPIVYESEVDEKCQPSYWFMHSMSEIISGILGSGMRVSHFREYPHTNREELYDCYQNQPAQLPMCFTLSAIKY